MKQYIMAAGIRFYGSRAFVRDTQSLQFMIRSLGKKTGILMSLCMLLCSLQVAAQKASPYVPQPTDPPGPPGPVTGPTSVVAGMNATYTVTAASGTVSYYAWSLSDPSAGTVSGTGTSATFQPFSNYHGGYVSVMCSAVNNIGSTAGTPESVFVVGTLVSGTVSPSSQTINYNTAPATLNSTGPTGGNGTYAYQWQSSPNNSTWTNISGATASSYTSPALTATTYYHLVTTSNGSSATSNSATVTVYPQLVSGNITSTSYGITSGTTPSPVTASAATGGSGTYTYQWQNSPNGSSWTNIPGATALSYSPPALTSTTYYHIVSSSNGASVTSGNCIITVYTALGSGTVSPSSQTVAYNTVPATLTSSSPTGGSGSYYYQWQSSTDDVNFTNIVGAYNLTYTPGAATSTTYYRLITKDNNVSGSATSNAVTVGSYAQLTPGNITPSPQYLNYNTASATLTLGTSTGGNGSYTYQWQSAPDAATWTNLSGITGLSYSPGTLTATMYYRVAVTSVGQTVNSSSGIVSVYPQLVSGTVSPSSQTINYNTTPTALTATAATGGNNSYTYQWQSSPDNATWTNVSGATALTYTVPALTATTYYHLVSTSNGVSVNSAAATITVYPQLISGTISPGSQSINYNTTPTTLTATAATGGNGSYIYQWQSSPDNSTWTNISGATALTYAPPALTATTYYHLVSTSNGVNVNSAAATVTVYSQLASGTISPASQTINYNTTPTALTATAATGGNGSYTYQWQSSPNNSTWTNVSGATALTYTVPALTATTYYHLVSTSNGVSVNSAAATITVYPQLVTGTISPSSQTINYNTTPTGLTATAATGGNGSYTYQWQSSPNNSTWTNVSGATALTYAPPALTATTYYHLVSTSNGANITSASATITVYSQLASGTVSPSSQTINYNTTPASITATAATGGNGSYTYQWQSSPNNSTWTNVSGATALTYAPPALTATTYYHLVSTSNGATITSASATVTVYPQLASGTVSPSSQTINYNTTPASITATAATGGNGSYTYQWQSSPDNATWTNVSGATALTYTPPALTATTYYHLVSTSNGASVNSATATITVYSQLVAGAISPASQTINYNTIPAGLTATAATGGNGSYTYQWQSSPDNAAWANVSGATALTYAPPALTSTTYYHLVSTSSGVNVNSGAATVTVSSAPPPPTPAPNISYTTSTAIAAGTPFTISPTNSGGAVPATTYGQVTTFAGSIYGSAGYKNDLGTAALFNEPRQMTMDASGNLYLADKTNNAIREITPAGMVTTFAGSLTGAAGYKDTTGFTAALFNGPTSVAIDASGNFFVSDYNNNAIRKITPAGVVSTFYSQANLAPYGICFDSSGNLVVTSQGLNQMLKISPAGAATVIAGSSWGYANGAGSVAQFGNPTDGRLDPSGNIIVADYYNNAVRKVTPAGQVTTVAGSLVSGNTGGFLDGVGTAAKFKNPRAVAIAQGGVIYVADNANNDIRRIMPDGTVTLIAGSPTQVQGRTNGVGTAATFFSPLSIYVDNTGMGYVVDEWATIRKLVLTGYTLKGALPAGLTFDPTTGTISGTPTGTIATVTDTITAYNATGYSTALVTFGVATPPAPSSNMNYVTTYAPRVQGITTSAGLYAASANNTQVETSIQYFDGLGRPLQTVEVMGSPTGKDMVQPFAYDALGREVVKYLPYTATTIADGSYKSNALTAGSGQAAFYATPPSGVSANTFPYSESLLESSPLNRLQEQGAPGDNWQLIGKAGTISPGHTAKISYLFNNKIAWSTDSVNSRQVALYTASVNTNQSRTLTRAANTAVYDTSQLYVTVTKDENWKTGRAGTVEEYKDKAGHVVLKRNYNYTTALQVLSTYYVYDDMGKLVFVLPPAAKPDSTAAISQTTLDNLCYQYRYDERGRLSQKKIPGKGWEYIVYNYIDEPVAAQDSLQRNQNNWVITKYDALGRPVLTGMWNNGNTAISQSLLQNTLTGITANLWESPISTGNGYNGVAWPTTSITATLSTNYYDSYSNIPGLPTKYTISSGVSKMLRGLPTVKQTAILNTPTDQLWDVIYYDDLGHTTKSYAQHYFNGKVDTGNYDLVTTTYNFTNLPTTVTRKHWNNTNTTYPIVTVVNNYIYDHRGRKLKTWEQITNLNSAPTTKTLISKADYNEIGQLMTKHLHSTDSINFFQNISYAYNERSWLLSSSAPLFSMQLQYNTGTRKSYNGNIMYQNWQCPGYPSHNYAYTYDKLNRLLSGMSDTLYKETSIGYDVMGNLTKLSRYQAGTIIDSLSYSYLKSGNASNQLQSITDATTNDVGLKHGTWSYTSAYDGNGNLTSDPAKGLTGITISYNLLNLPQSVTGSKTITYTYDAMGNKLRRVSTNTGKTDYISGIQYDDNNSGTSVLSFIQTEEGQATSMPGGYDYTYYLSDNLGNTRVTFDTKNGSAMVTQKDDYYPFGMDINAKITSIKNEYLYNKKELQEELGQYDYGARFYDPVIARWNVIDKMADHPNQIDKSPYAYGWDNPIVHDDKDGNCPMCLILLPEIVEATAFIIAGTAVTMTVIHHAGSHDYSAPRDATTMHNATLGQPPIVKANGTFGDKKDTQSKTDKEGLRNAKDRNGVPRSQQPDRTVKPGTPEGDAAGLDHRNEVQHEYTNSEGKKVVIRKDKPHEYGDGGKGDQGKHYNAGQEPQNQKDLNQHHNISN